MTLRLLPYAIAAGPRNMAADETLLHAASRGQACLRFYGWSQATLSLGYSQACRSRPLPDLPWVRRPTGGATLVHHFELTYALALPAHLVGSARGWMRKMHDVTVQALCSIAERKTVTDRIKPWTQLGHSSPTASTLCFQQHAVGDLMCGTHKIMGSSQRKQRQCLLQHGALLLAASPLTPQLPGLRELIGIEPAVDKLAVAILHAFQETTGWDAEEADWSPEECDAIALLEEQKYRQSAWNEKR